MVACIFELNASLYGCLGGILTKGHSVLESAGLGIAFIFGASSLYWTCAKAHHVTDSVRSRYINSYNLEYINEKTNNKSHAGGSVNTQQMCKISHLTKV
jgi:hypothetical protein